MVGKLPDDITDLIRELHISPADGHRLQQLADEAVARFESDEDAVSWLESEVRNRYPNLWWTIRKRLNPSA
jgi:hypothetical protein